MDRLLEIANALAADAAYAALDDNAAEARLNEKAHPGRVASSALFEVIMDRGWFAKVKLLSENTTAPAAQRLAAIDALALLQDRDRELNYASAESGARMIATLDALIAGGALDAATRDIILGLGANLRTRAEVLGLGAVTGYEVKQARAAHGQGGA